VFVRYLDVTVDAGATLLRDWLLPRIEKADVVGLRTGFLTLAGTEAVIPLLRQVLERNGQMYAVVGGHPEQTDPAALMELARLVADFPAHAEVYLATPGSGRQNGKTYYVRGEQDGAAAYVGSANLTRGGLETNHEAGILLDDADDDPATVEAILNGIKAWCGHPSAELVTPDVAIAFAAKARAARIGRSWEPGPANSTWRLADMLPEALEWIEAAGSVKGGGLTGVPTGFADLDALTNGLQPGWLVVVGGRPSLGKSVFLLDVCRSAALRNSLPSALFSLEMTRQELNIRLLSAEARVPQLVMRSGQMNDNDWARLARRMAEIADAPLYINDTGTLSVQALCDEATRMVRDHGVMLIAVDYLQLITPELRGETREREVGEIARRLKALALDLGVPVVVAAQLNRDPEYRIDKRPLLADLRESDAIAQAADLVILLHREDAYERESPRAGEADFILAKNRHGPAATVTVAFQGHYFRFVDMAPS
jgi:replicative DNA helicase/HKD family nuclease